MSALGLAPAAAGEESKRPGADRVVVSPEPTDELLANPGMGWQTFHQTRKQDRNLPDWIPSTVHYARWGWKELEPEAGKLNETFLDQTLRETRDSGQQLAFRVMCCSTSRGNPYHPSWLKQVGGRIFEDANYDQNGPFSIPDLDDPKVLDRHLDFIRRLAVRYDGHPDIDHVDLGTVGWWGEWHLSGCKYKMPTPQNQKKIVDCYLDAFKKTPVIMLIGGDEASSTPSRAEPDGAPIASAIWADSLATGATCSKDIRSTSFRAASKTLGRKPPSPGKAAGTCASGSAKVGRSATFSTMPWPCTARISTTSRRHCPRDPKSAPKPNASSAGSGTASSSSNLSTPPRPRPANRSNSRHSGKTPVRPPATGRTASPIASPMRPAKLACSPDASRADRWMPGTVKPFAGDFLTNPPDLPLGKVVEETESLPLPAELAAGTYRLAIALVAPDGTTPVIRLGIRGRQADGWYDLSRIEITR